MQQNTCADYLFFGAGGTVRTTISTGTGAPVGVVLRAASSVRL